MPSPDYPDRLSPDERRRELARILAKGLLRLKKHSLEPHSAESEKPSESHPKPLDRSRSSSPHVPGR